MPEIQKVNYHHDQMIDLLIANPGISQAALAQHFGYTASWVSIIMSSDAFKERLAARRAEIIDPILTVTVEERFEALTARSLEVLQEKLAMPVNMVPEQLALQAAQLGAKALGKGGFGQTKVAVQVNNTSVNIEERNARIAQRLASLVRENRPQELTHENQTVEVVATEVVGTPAESA